MRITSTMMGSTVVQSLSDIRNRMLGLQTDLATSKRLHKPSDGPSATVDSLRLRSTLNRLERYDRNIEDARGWLSTTDSALDQLNGVAQRAHELAIQAANDTLSQSARDNVAAEIDRLLEGAVQYANTSYAESYLFGGLKGDAEPFTLASGAVTYNGDAGVVKREVAPGTQVQINADGQALADTGLFAALTDLSERLKAGNRDAISSQSVAELSNSIDSLVELRASLGARFSQVELMERLAKDTRVNLESNQEILEGIDLEKTMIEFNQMESAYQTALAIGARVMPPSLLDFLR